MTDNGYRAIIEGLTKGELEFNIELHGQDTALLEHMAETSVSAFRKIPVELITEKMMDMSLVNLCVMHGEMQCHIENDYEQSAINLLEVGAHISSFHRALLTEKIVGHALQRNIADTLSFRRALNPKQQALFTPEMLKFAVENVPDSVRKLSREEIEQIGDEAILSAFMKDKVSSYCLFQIGKPKLFAKMVASGHWMFPGVFGEHPKPTDLGEAIRQRMKLQSIMAKEIAYYNAYIAGSPLEVVAPLMTSGARRKVLLEIFTGPELLEVFKDDREMKGLILEEAMGL
jgi:hypothetical protein